MPKQPAIPGLRDAMKKQVTRREQLLAEMDAVVPWGRLLALVEPHYRKAGPKGGRPPMPLETMLRVYFLQNWFALSDPMADETHYDSEAMRRFAGIELGDDRIPDETTILNLCHLMERHGLTEAIFADVNANLADKGMVASPAYLAARGRPASLAELSGHCLVGIRPTLSLCPTGPRGPETLTLEAQVAVNDPKTIVSVLRGGAGIGVVPRFLAQAGLDDGSLEILLPEYRLAPAEMSVVYYGSGTANPRANLFASFLQTEMRDRVANIRR